MNADIKRVMEVSLANENETAALGARLVPALRPGMVVYLKGDLGAGKTTLARGLLRALGVTGRIKSPTFSLVELYEISSLYLYHFDFYRFTNPQEWVEAGFRESCGPHAICLMEWPERVGDLLPPPDITVELEIGGASRRALISATLEAETDCLQALQQRSG